MLPAMLAEHLGMPQLTALSSVEISDTAVSGSRAADAGAVAVSAPLPAVISITEALTDARLPNFKGLMAAKKKPYETVPVADFGVVREDFSNTRLILLAVPRRQPRASCVKRSDRGARGRSSAAS